MNYMKSISFSTIFILMTCGFVACNSQRKMSKATDAAAIGSSARPSAQSAALPVFEKLLGTWQSEHGKNFERWTKTSDHSYHSSVFRVKGADTTWIEQANIYKANNNWVFDNKVSNQNNEQAIKFVAASVSPTAVQFSNPAHDFPTDVCYTLPDPGTLHAFIIGPNGKGGKDTIHFNYKRLN
jgi:hypothetical protein